MPPTKRGVRAPVANSFFAFPGATRSKFRTAFDTPVPARRGLRLSGSARKELSNDEKGSDRPVPYQVLIVPGPRALLPAHPGGGQAPTDFGRVNRADRW